MNNLKLELGDKVIYIKPNGEILKTYIVDFNGSYISEFEEYNCKILKIERPSKYETIYKTDGILDKKEKEYLSNLIKPFRDNITYILKTNYNDSEKKIIYECILIKTINSETKMPPFEKGTMYKGMELGIPYSLEGLDL